VELAVSHHLRQAHTSLIKLLYEPLSQNHHKWNETPPFFEAVVIEEMSILSQSREQVGLEQFVSIETLAVYCLLPCSNLSLCESDHLTIVRTRDALANHPNTLTGVVADLVLQIKLS
jgi:hypothetical protein